MLKSLEDKFDEDIEQAWIEEIKSGEVDTIPAEKVLAEARKILKK